MRIAAINDGYKFTKCYDGVHEPFMILSAVREVADKDDIAGVENIVEYDGRIFGVGRGVIDYELGFDKTTTINHKVLVLTALSKITDISDSYNIAVSLPVSYCNQHNKAKVAEYLKTDEREKITVNGTDYWIGINDVTVYKEGLAPIYNNPNVAKYKVMDNKLYIGDCGGYTFLGLGVRYTGKFSVIEGSDFTLDNGSHKIYEDIAKGINSDFNLNIKADSVERILKDGLEVEGQKAPIDTVVLDILSDVVDEFLKNAKVNKWEYRTSPIYFVGGGLLIPSFKDIILTRFPGAEFATDLIFQTVKGLYTVAQVVYGE